MIHVQTVDDNTETLEFHVHTHIIWYAEILRFDGPLESLNSILLVCRLLSWLVWLVIAHRIAFALHHRQLLCQLAHGTNAMQVLHYIVEFSSQRQHWVMLHQVVWCVRLIVFGCYCSSHLRATQKPRFWMFTWLQHGSILFTMQKGHSTKATSFCLQPTQTARNSSRDM